MTSRRHFSIGLRNAVTVVEEDGSNYTSKEKKKILRRDLERLKPPRLNWY